MAMNNGLPSLTIAFKAAAVATVARSKKGYVGVIIRDEQSQGIFDLTSKAFIPEKLGQDNKTYIERAFLGSDRGTPSKVVLLVIAPGTEDTSALEAGITLLESKGVDYVAPPPDTTEAEETVLVEWVKKRREAYFTEKLILCNATTPPNEKGIINFVESEEHFKVEGKATDPKTYVSRIAGILAGIPQSMSSTYASLPEVTAVTPRTLLEQTDAINDGKLILIHDGQVAKIARGVNSLTTVPIGGKEDWSKIKIVEGMDLVTYFLRNTIQGEYLGRYSNTYNNKLLLITAISDYLTYLEASGVLNPGQSDCQIDLEAQEQYLLQKGVDTTKLSEQELKEYQTDSWVFIRCSGKFTDAMEDFKINFDNL